MKFQNNKFSSNNSLRPVFQNGNKTTKYFPLFMTFFYVSAGNGIEFPTCHRPVNGITSTVFTPLPKISATGRMNKRKL